MVKAYLRYEPSHTFGVVCSSQCNVEAYQNLVLTGCNEQIVVWNLKQQEKVRTLLPDAAEQNKSYCSRLQRQPSGTLLAAGYGDGWVRIWSLSDYSNVLKLQGHRSQITCIAWGPPGNRTILCSGSADTDIVVWDTVAESGVARLRGHRDQVTDCAFLSKKAPTIVSCSKDKAIKVWSVLTQVCLQTIVEHSELWSLAVNEQSTRLLVGSTDHLLRIWGISEDDEPLAFMGSLQRNKDALVGIRMTNDKVFMHGRSKTLEVMSIHSVEEAARRKKQRKRRAAQKRKKKNEKSDENDADNNAEEQESDAFQATDEFLLLPVVRAQGKITSLAWDEKTSRALLGLQTNALEVVPVKVEDGVVNTEGSCVMERPGHRNAVRAVAVSSDDAMIMSTSKESVKIWSAQTGNCVRTMASSYGLCGIFLAGNQQVVIGTMSGEIEMYDLGMCEKVQSSKSHEGSIYGVAEHPAHNGFATCSADKTVRCFELTQDGSRLSYKEASDRVIEVQDDALSVAFSPNGKWIGVSLLDATIQLYFADSLKFYLSFYGHKLPVVTHAFSSDSTMLATGSADKNIKLWSTQFGNCHKSIRAHDDSVMQVQFMPGTHYLVSVGRDRAVKVWDCDTYEFISTWGYHLSEVWGLALSYDASYVVTSGADKSIRIWKRTTEQLFLDEEREKEMDEQFEQDALRDDKGTNDVVALRATRRTIESVQTTEKLMEVLDQADGDELVARMGHTPLGHVLRCVQTMSASNIYEVLLALPFQHAVKLLEFLADFFQLGCDGSVYKDELLCCGLETACRTALITVHVHHRQLTANTNLLIRLRDHLRGIAISQRDLCGLNLAAMTQFADEMKQSRATFDDNPAKRPKLYV